MLVGVPKEIKNHEYRVSISPEGVRELVHHGHQVIVETQAGHAIGYDDSHYMAAGALISEGAKDVYAKADMIVKVKEPQPIECEMIRENQIIFCYLHLAAEVELANKLIESKCIAISYETITAPDGSLPLLAPMSEVAGRMAVQAGAQSLEMASGGSGTLLSGVPGVAPGKVLIIGGGVVGTNAAQVAVGMGADVTIVEKSIPRIRQLEFFFQNRARIVYSTSAALEEYIAKTDLLIGAVLIPGAAAPKVISEAMVRTMKRGSVVVDVAIDQGGCLETSRPTTHENPTYKIGDVVHYCVTNIPGAVAGTASKALENSTLPYIIALADKGVRQALSDDKHFLNGLNLHKGRVTYEVVAKELHHSYTPPRTVLGG